MVAGEKKTTMKFTLLTYDSTLAHNAGYYTSSAAAFAEHLARLVDQFAAASGVEKSKIYWMPLEHSEWFRDMVILYATVPPDWEPTPETEVWDKTRNLDWFPNLAKNLSCWIAGKGNSVDLDYFPPTAPHRLFHSAEARLFKQ